MMICPGYDRRGLGGMHLDTVAKHGFDASLRQIIVHIRVLAPVDIRLHTPADSEITEE